jgi:hypothetical protein
VQPQLREAPEVGAVARDERQVVVQRGRGDEHVRVADELAAPAQVTAYAGEAPHDRPRQGQHVDGAQEPAEDALAAGRVPAVVDPLVDLPVSHQADREPVGGERPKHVHGSRSALQPVGHPIAVDQIAHSATGGRDDSRRLAAMSALSCSVSTNPRHAPAVARKASWSACVRGRLPRRRGRDDGHVTPAALDDPGLVVVLDAVEDARHVPGEFVERDPRRVSGGHVPLGAAPTPPHGQVWQQRPARRPGDGRSGGHAAEVPHRRSMPVAA